MNDLVQFSDELRAFEVKRVILSTTSWLAATLPSKLSWTARHFASTPAASVPATKGVYTFVVQPGIAEHPLCAYLLYVGMTAAKSGFRSRYSTYRAEYGNRPTARPLIHRMVNKWYQHLWFCFAEVPTIHIKKTEDVLLAAYLPPMNSEFPASISPAIRAF